jgi:hypothetical protein
MDEESRKGSTPSTPIRTALQSYLIINVSGRISLSAGLTVNYCYYLALGLGNRF